MGGAESKLGGLEGYQIVRVMCNSPAHVAGFVAFFDFITAVDDLHLDRDDPTFFFDYIRRNKDKAIKCQVFNLRVRATRELVVVPTDCWGGVGLLGCNVCWESVERATESTWHVVEVSKDGPAYHADIMAQRDYILAMQPALDGASITTFRDGGDFHSRIEEWRARMAVANRSAPRTLLLLVFDAVDNSVKEVLLDMSSSNSLGMDVSSGYLHAIPPLPQPDRVPTMRRFVALTAVPAPAPPVAAALPHSTAEVPTHVVNPAAVPPQQQMPPPPVAAVHNDTVRSEHPVAVPLVAVPPPAHPPVASSPTYVSLPLAAAPPTTAPVVSSPIALQPPAPAPTTAQPFAAAAAVVPPAPTAAAFAFPVAPFPSSTFPSTGAQRTVVPATAAAAPAGGIAFPMFPAPPSLPPTVAHA